ncbi:hypothetical protein FYJ35_01780 [Lachnospiraceae bacterium Oil+RF-744-WCA-WT-11]|uniref:Bacteriophage Gp15 protein n=2 Tax=Porcincola intestinalis TaxID=2606632 RepID=A0A6L5X0B8_9FIRM|nr:hypothetical protein [Porcincola intestinalis]
MSPYDLPTSLTIHSRDYAIRTDFRAILDILIAENDPELDDIGKTAVLLGILYKDVPVDTEEAVRKGCEFIDMGMKDDGKRRPRVMDWKQDAPVIIPAVNRVAGVEIRALPYLHWWSFLGYYQEIGQSYFSEIVNVRLKKARGEKLEKWEQDFYKDNRASVDLNHEEERSAEEKQELRKLFGLEKR